METLALYQQIHSDLQKVWESADLSSVSKYCVYGNSNDFFFFNLLRFFAAKENSGLSVAKPGGESCAFERERLRDLGLGGVCVHFSAEGRVRD